jgi:hypothetical protein
VSDPLTVLQVGTEDVGGGAEKVMSDLHHAYLARGIDSWIAVGIVHRPDERTLLIDNEKARGPWTRLLGVAVGRPLPEAPLPRRLAVARRALADPARYRRIAAGLEDFAFPATAGLLDLPPRRPDVLRHPGRRHPRTLTLPPA